MSKLMSHRRQKSRAEKKNGELTGPMNFISCGLGRNRISSHLNVFSFFSLSKLLSSSASTSAYSRSYAGDSLGGSSVYQKALQLGRPTKITCQEHLQNSVSFIGSVVRPVRRCDTRNGQFGVYTFLEVTSSCKDTTTKFQILLMMWDKLALISLKHLRPNDLIYVSGHLDSYEKVSDCGKPEIIFKVSVKELNYVSRKVRYQSHQEPRSLAQKEETKPTSKSVEQIEDTITSSARDRLHLWQIFFANPHEWWDNRRDKLNPYCPDFKHKDTKESLWINHNDPPWVREQLQLMDNKSGRGRPKDHRSSRTLLSQWKFDF